MSRAVLLSLAALAGCVAVPDPDPSQWPIARVEIERAIPTDDPAEATYRTYCIACHGVDGRGAGARTGADFTSLEGPLTRPDEQLLVSILEGRTGEIGVMPAHRAILGEERCRAVLGYVRTRFGAGVPIRAPEPDAPDGGPDAP
jgi:mono/diheme cytochrome c family protein